MSFEAGRAQKQSGGSSHPAVSISSTKLYSTYIVSGNSSSSVVNKNASVAKNLAAVLASRKEITVQSGWQREVGHVPQTAFSEGCYEFKFRSDKVLRIPESFEAIGTRVWDCAASMSRWFEKGDFVRGKVILELGSGTGLLGLACATLGASRVVLTDLQSIHHAMVKSIDATGLGDICVARALDWNDIDAVDALKKEFGPFDMIVASDVLVFAGDAPTTGATGLIRALIHLAEPKTTEILMGCNKNRHGFIIGFYANPPTHLFDINVVDKSEVDEEFYTDMIMLYRMWLKEPSKSS